MPKIKFELPTEKVAPNSVDSQPLISEPITYYSGVANQALPQTGITYHTQEAGITYQTQQAEEKYQTQQNGLSYKEQQVPKITYSTQTATIQPSLVSNYAASPEYRVTQETHGYVTSAGLSASSSTGKTVTPAATYAQAPIIAKITAAPLLARFSIIPPKSSYVPENFVTEESSYSSGSLARASLHSSDNIRMGGPVVSQVFPAPSAGYAASPALGIQQNTQFIAPVQYTAGATSGIQYAQPPSATSVQIAPTVSQYSTSSTEQVSSSEASLSKQYYSAQPTPVVTQHTVPAVQYTPTATKYATSSVSQYSAPVTQYNAPIVAQYTVPAVTHYSAPVNVQYSTSTATHYSAPTGAQYSVPASTHYTTPPVSLVSQYAVPRIVSHSPLSNIKYTTSTTSRRSGHTKNVHREFLENYVSWLSFFI